MISFLFETNEGIRNFFEGDDKYIPISEYKYLHDRPLLRPSFLTQVDDLVQSVGAKIMARNLKGAHIDKFIEFAIALGKQMEGDMTDDKARCILFSLRDLRNFCMDLDQKLK